MVKSFVWWWWAGGGLVDYTVISSDWGYSLFPIPIFPFPFPIPNSRPQFLSPSPSPVPNPSPRSQSPIPAQAQSQSLDNFCFLLPAWSSHYTLLVGIDRHSSGILEQINKLELLWGPNARRYWLIELPTEPRMILISRVFSSARDNDSVNCLLWLNCWAWWLDKWLLWESSALTRRIGGSREHSLQF